MPEFLSSAYIFFFDYFFLYNHFNKAWQQEDTVDMPYTWNNVVWTKLWWSGYSAPALTYFHLSLYTSLASISIVKLRWVVLIHHLNKFPWNCWVLKSKIHFNGHGTEMFLFLPFLSYRVPREFHKHNSMIFPWFSMINNVISMAL